MLQAACMQHTVLTPGVSALIGRSNAVVTAIMHVCHSGGQCFLTALPHFPPTVADSSHPQGLQYRTRQMATRGPCKGMKVVMGSLAA
jgi:hypothetical protein